MGTELTGNSGQAGGQIDQNPQGNGGQTPNPAGQTGSWRDALPPELRDNPALATFTDVPNLAKSYVHAQTMIGKKGVIVPTDKSSDEDWDSFYKAIGRPEKDKYEIEVPKDKNVNPEIIGAFKEIAHKAGILPKQAKAVVEWFTGFEENIIAGRRVEQENQTKAGLDALKKEWGQGYDKEVATARLAVKEVGGEDFAKFLDESGLGNQPAIIKAMAKFGKLLGEDKLRGAVEGRMGKTPAEIQTEINDLTSDPSYADPTHGKHKATVEKVSALYKQLYT